MSALSENPYRERLLEKANSLPLTPGVYLMKDAGGHVIYVGKSRKLHNRVSQYFQNGEKNAKTWKMVSKVYDFDYFLCATEIEALTLENSLIKQYTPKYNIRLKDAKSYPYIKITNETYPRILFTRTRLADKARYFGPYSGVSTVFSVLGVLRKTLGLPTCSRVFPRDIGKERPCLYYQMGRCCGVCTGQVTPEEYGKLIQVAADILRGNTLAARRKLEEEMTSYAETEQYEAAAKCRDSIKALDALSEKQYVVGGPDADQDVIALYEGDVGSCISVFYVRQGAVTDKNSFLLGADCLTDEESLSAFLCEHYRSRSYIPSQVLISFDLGEEERATVTAFLEETAGHHVELRTPERGPLRALCETVRSNAEEAVNRWKTDTAKDERVLARLAELLCLEVYPTRIEAYDISNLGSEHLTAGMIVCEEGKFKKSDYRTFSIKSVEGTDDYASMYETLDRRLTHLENADTNFGDLPDLILLDGGRGHVSTVRECLRAHGLDIPVFGMVKDDYHKTRALCTEDEEINIAREREVFMLIYKIQEEVHRYTVSRMEGAKRKTLKHSILEKIPGIGPSKAAALLAAFGSISELKKADAERIAAVKGISRSDAEAIRRYYDEKTTDRRS